MAALANDEVWEALKVAREAGIELNKWFAAFGQYAGEIKEKGFPVAFGSFSWAPFDILGDTCACATSQVRCRCAPLNKFMAIQQLS